LLALKDKDAKEQLLEFLLKMDEIIPYNIMARVSGFEIFGIIFKLTYYDDHTDNSVSNILSNTNFEILDNQKVCWSMT
jgi:hypothetical protein